MGRFIGLLVMALSSVCWARTSVQPYDGYVEVEPGIYLYAKVTPGVSDAPPIVLLNGLTQDFDFWQTDVPELKQNGATIVRIDLALQGRSMARRLAVAPPVGRPVLPPLIMRGGFWNVTPTFPATTVEEQSRYVSELLKKVGINQPVVLLGLSYGGGLAMQMAADFPDQIKSAILAAPFVFPLPEQDNLIKMFVKMLQSGPNESHDQLVSQLKSALRKVYPMAPEGSISTFIQYMTMGWPQWKAFSYDDLYDFVMRALVISTYHLLEPEILKWDPPYESIAVSELVRGIRHLDYKSLLPRIHVPLFLIQAGQDQYIPKTMLDEFWANVPSEIKGSRILIQGSEHKMNEAVGPFLAAWAWKLVTNPDLLKHPGSFLGEPKQGLAKELGGENRVFKLPVTIPILSPSQAANSTLCEGALAK